MWVCESRTANRSADAVAPWPQSLHSTVLKLLLNDFPGLLFFTTYTLLVLFWAEIYHQARSQATARLRPTFLTTNVAVYTVQICLLLLCGFQAMHHIASVRHRALA